ncbi:MAG: hypothetical protein J5736_03790, partial [Bacilli bacterium]|nr:hypothetical protein [Bacilli bacterium]
MAEKDNRRISQKAWGIYRADPGKTAGLLAFVYTALLICLGIGVWLGGAFVVLFLLVGVPAVFAAFLWLFSLQKQGDVLLSDFLRAYFAYFNSPFR